MKKSTQKLLLLNLILIVGLLLTSGFQNVGGVMQDDTGDGGDTTNDNADNPACTGEATKPHPILGRVAAQYGVAYEEVVALFCEGYGVGEIMLALETKNITGEDAAAVLDKKGKGNAWGLVWQELGLIGRPEDAGPPAHAKNNKDKDKGKPEDAGKPDNNDKGGKPEDAGKSDNNDKGGKPEDAGGGDKGGQDKGKDGDKGNQDKGATEMTCPDGSALTEEEATKVETLAEQYDVDKDKILEMFCDGMSFEEIEEALNQ